MQAGWKLGDADDKVVLGLRRRGERQGGQADDSDGGSQLHVPVPRCGCNDPAIKRDNRARVNDIAERPVRPRSAPPVRPRRAVPHERRGRRQSRPQNLIIDLYQGSERYGSATQIVPANALSGPMWRHLREVQCIFGTVYYVSPGEVRQAAKT